MSDSRNQGLYPKETIANLLNVSERRVDQLVKSKVIPKAGRGVFDLGPTVQSYIRYLQGLCSGAIKSGEPSELDKRLLEAKVLERESKARQAKYRADRMERELLNNDLRDEIREIPIKVLKRVKLYDPENRQYVAEAVHSVVNEILNGCEKS
ncbi:MAG: hypothetical protein IJ697_06700 [Synergistaceae bacterium]|nr:hypothetical protein [Synergistaceae bacterium]